MDSPPTDAPADERRAFYYMWGAILAGGGAIVGAAGLLVLVVCYRGGVFGNPDDPDVIRTVMVPMSVVAVASILMLILCGALGGKYLQARYLRRAGPGGGLDPGKAADAGPDPRTAVRCRQCLAPNDETAKFCNQCGSAI